MAGGFFRTALVPGLLSAIGPFAIDMYLPALPSIGQSRGASVPAPQPHRRCQNRGVVHR